VVEDAIQAAEAHDDIHLRGGSADSHVDAAAPRHDGRCGFSAHGEDCRHLFYVAGKDDDGRDLAVHGVAASLAIGQDVLVARDAFEFLEEPCSHLGSLQRLTIRIQRSALSPDPKADR